LGESRRASPLGAGVTPDRHPPTAPQRDPPPQTGPHTPLTAPNARTPCTGGVGCERELIVSVNATVNATVLQARVRALWRARRLLGRFVRILLAGGVAADATVAATAGLAAVAAAPTAAARHATRADELRILLAVGVLLLLPVGQLHQRQLHDGRHVPCPVHAVRRQLLRRRRWHRGADRAESDWTDLNGTRWSLRRRVSCHVQHMTVTVTVEHVYTRT